MHNSKKSHRDKINIFCFSEASLCLVLSHNTQSQRNREAKNNCRQRLNTAPWLSVMQPKKVKINMQI